MKGWMAVMVALSVVSFLPAAQAHACNGHGCGPCVKGEQHHHNDWVRGQCSSSASWHAENGHHGQRAEVPGLGALAAALVVGLAAVLVGRR